MKLNLIVFVFFILVLSCKAQEHKSYNGLKTEIAQTRDSLQRVYNSDSSKRDSVLKFAYQYVFDRITNDLFDAWHGTPWKFYGQTTVPREGSIACGYFVSTVLEHAGFKIPRVKWAQMASEPVILKLTSDVKRFRDKPVEDVKAYIKNREDGLYIVGLDIHVGFVYKKGDTIKFVHSNYYQPSTGVMSQDLDTHNPLKDSKYRITGRILSKENMLAWLQGKKIE